MWTLYRMWTSIKQSQHASNLVYHVVRVGLSRVHSLCFEAFALRKLEVISKSCALETYWRGGVGVVCFILFFIWNKGLSQSLSSHWGSLLDSQIELEHVSNMSGDSAFWVGWLDVFFLKARLPCSGLHPFCDNCLRRYLHEVLENGNVSQRVLDMQIAAGDLGVEISAPSVFHRFKDLGSFLKHVLYWLRPISRRGYYLLPLRLQGLSVQSQLADFLWMSMLWRAFWEPCLWRRRLADRQLKNLPPFQQNDIPYDNMIIHKINMTYHQSPPIITNQQSSIILRTCLKAPSRTEGAGQIRAPGSCKGCGFPGAHGLAPGQRN